MRRPLRCVERLLDGSVRCRVLAVKRPRVAAQQDLRGVARALGHEGRVVGDAQADGSPRMTKVVGLSSESGLTAVWREGQIARLAPDSAVGGGGYEAAALVREDPAVSSNTELVHVRLEQPHQGGRDRHDTDLT